MNKSSFSQIKPSPKFNTTTDVKRELVSIPQLCQKIMIDGKEIPIYTYTLLLIGILNRTYELGESANWAIENKRPHTAANMLRSLIETLGFTHYTLRHVTKKDRSGVFEKIAGLLLGSRKGDTPFQSINILTCIDGATRSFPQLRQNYDDLSEMVHPNARSLLHFGRAEDEASSRTVGISIPFYEFKQRDEERITNQVGECCYYIKALCEKIAETLKSEREI